MNYDEIQKLMLNNRRKNITKEQEHVEVNLETGEVNRVSSHEVLSVDVEPDYIKLYTGFQLLFNNLDQALMPYIIAFGRYMTYANHKDSQYRLSVTTNKMTREGVADAVGVTDSGVKKAIKKLVDSHVFIPYIDKSGKKTRGVYFVNPWVMAKGEWKDVKALRSEFEFVTGASATVAIDEDGSRKVVVPLHYRETESGQLTLGLNEYEK